MHINIRGGIAQFDKWSTVVELCSLKKPDVLVVTETGHNNHPSTLRWLTKNMKPNELNDLDDRSHDQFQVTLPYNMYSTEGISTPGERGGVVVLVNTSLSHRVLGQSVIPSHKRWLTITLATYMRPSLQSPHSPRRVARIHRLRCSPRYSPAHSSSHLATSTRL